MQKALTLQGQAPAVRASRALRAINVRKMCVSALTLVRRQSLTFAAISAASCYAGALIECNPLTYAAAFTALGFVRLAGSAQKGGEA